jgi:hypothetical protein
MKNEIGVGPNSFIMMEQFNNSYELFDFGIGNIAVSVEKLV